MKAGRPSLIQTESRPAATGCKRPPVALAGAGGRDMFEIGPWVLHRISGASVAHARSFTPIPKGICRHPSFCLIEARLIAFGR